MNYNYNGPSPFGCSEPIQGVQLDDDDDIDDDDIDDVRCGLTAATAEEARTASMTMSNLTSSEQSGAQLQQLNQPPRTVVTTTPVTTDNTASLQQLQQEQSIDHGGSLRVVGVNSNSNNNISSSNNMFHNSGNVNNNNSLNEVDGSWNQPQQQQQQFQQHHNDISSTTGNFPASDGRMQHMNEQVSMEDNNDNHSPSSDLFSSELLGADRSVVVEAEAVPISRRSLRNFSENAPIANAVPFFHPPSPQQHSSHVSSSLSSSQQQQHHAATNTLLSSQHGQQQQQQANNNNDGGLYKASMDGQSRVINESQEFRVSQPPQRTNHLLQQQQQQTSPRNTISDPIRPSVPSQQQNRQQPRRTTDVLRQSQPVQPTPPNGGLASAPRYSSWSTNRGRNAALQQQQHPSLHNTTAGQKASSPNDDNFELPAVFQPAPASENRNTQEDQPPQNASSKSAACCCASNAKKVIMLGIVIILAMSLGLVGGICGFGNCSLRRGDETGDRSAVTLVTENDDDTGVPENESTNDVETSTTLQTIVARKKLNCGIPEQDDDDNLNGDFDIDLCNAIAAALFGSSNNTVNFITNNPTTRFVSLSNNDVDVLIGSITHTMERELVESTTGDGFAFSIPYLYGGLRFGGLPNFVECADTRVANEFALNCADLKICVVHATTYAAILETIVDESLIAVLPDYDAFYRNFRQGLCNVLAGDQYETAESTIRMKTYFGEYATSDSLHSKEPLTIVTRQDDPRWSDFVNWIIQGLLFAEENDFTKSRAVQFVEDDTFGQPYRFMFRNALAEVGNYGEIYERHLEQVLPRKEVNRLNDGSTGLIYSMPFGNTTAVQGSPSPMLDEIRARGFLKCGVSARSSFANLVNNTFVSGHSVDFCRALSAAIFNGVVDTIEYHDLTSSERFIALDEKRVDVLSRLTTWTFERDVKEKKTGRGFNFAQPDFYDGLSFGGTIIASNSMAFCAATQTILGVCAILKICVNDSTTSLTRLRELFPENHIVVRSSGNETAQGIRDGVCNAIAGGVFDVIESNIRTIGGYTGDYELGTSQRFSKDPLSLVTREDDPKWSAFVYWVVSALFYADEMKISSTNAEEMPHVLLFGSNYNDMLRDAVSAVGNYGDIYNRNIQMEHVRSGLNLLNSNPLRSQHYTMPGLNII